MPGKPSGQPKPITEQWRPELTRLPRLTLLRRAFRLFSYVLIKLVVKVCLRVSAHGMQAVPRHGPLLIVINHLGDADVMALISALPAAPDVLGKVELYDLRPLGRLMDWYGVIWLHRGRPDKRALRAALDGLAEGRVIVIAPEGRQSLTGALEQGSEGAAFLAQKSGAPILPIAITGTANDTIYAGLKRMRRAAVNVRAGKMFRLAAPASGPRETARRESTRLIMQSLAALLPEEYRGEYSEAPPT